jgi:autophagy-related protein 9
MEECDHLLEDKNNTDFNFEELGSILEKKNNYSDFYFEELGYERKKDTIKSHNKSFLFNIFGSKNQEIKTQKYTNTDLFYQDLYDYYYKGGFYNIITTDITEIISSIFGILFLSFIFIFLDWENLLQCGNQNTKEDCGDISDFIKPSVPNIFLILILFISFLITILKIFSCFISYRKLCFIHNYYKEALDISLKDLQTMPWARIIYKITQYTKTTTHDITNKIMRNENYYIALIHKNIFGINPSIYTKQLEVNIKYIIFDDLENISVSKLRRKFVLFGILNLLFSIIIFLYLLLYFFISNVDDYYSKHNNIGLRKYSLHTTLKFRKYNELKHFFDKRINNSIVHANDYIKQFPSHLIEIICKFICIITGSFFGFFLILSILDENILLHVTFLDRSILFYTGIIGAISSFARGYIRAPEDTVYNPENAMKKLYKYTLYMPSKWKGVVNTYKVRDDFLNMYPNKLSTLFYDLLSVITTPFILLFRLPEKATDIFNFIKINTIELENIGSICNFASFNTNSNYYNDKQMQSSMTLYEENNSTHDTE